MFYTRGTRDDYDRIANVTEDEGWSWDHLFLYMLKSERWTAPSDGHNTTGQFDPSVHRSSGIEFRGPERGNAVQSGHELGQSTGDRLEERTGWKQAITTNGLRSSAATSYLAPNFINRPNLHVVLNTQVTRVLSHKDALSFTTVEYITAQGNRSTITAGKEVILSAGAVGTPHILLHSGIGDAHALSKLGIWPVHNLPSVGQNLTDHPALHTLWLVNSTNTYETLKRNATVAVAALAEWTQMKQGPLVTGPGSHIGWARVSGNDSTIFDNTADSSAGPTSPHFELIFAPGSLGPPPPTGNLMGCTSIVVSPSSPAPAFSDYVITQLGYNATATDADLDTFIQEQVGSIFHPVGTAAMTKRGADYGVVDPDLLVKGLKALRVVDLSVLVSEQALIQYRRAIADNRDGHLFLLHTPRRRHILSGNELLI
ncbi:unnamed protein product [Mycena citricolor]|uniref:Glucose-methanol-choline oxidoreductase N-terminal domain-containing protein n=1 Tax=Mycena citricolor TaxID=2018698 RepID=A0AAD2JZR1_9AGAR|nr:unnamed protein product [Mycena citricolor]